MIDLLHFPLQNDSHLTRISINRHAQNIDYIAQQRRAKDQNVRKARVIGIRIKRVVTIKIVNIIFFNLFYRYVVSYLLIDIIKYYNCLMSTIK